MRWIVVLIQIDKLKRRPRQIDVAEQAKSFPVLAELEAEGSVVFTEKITGSLEATWVGDLIKVSGDLATKVSSPCCRCLLPVSGPIDVSVLLTYVNREEDEAVLDEELELQGEDLGLIHFSGTDIDLKPDVEQEIVMALPQQPLCKEACKGLCLSCGCNLNQNTCDCEPRLSRHF
jgi:uncharacterized protein